MSNQTAEDWNAPKDVELGVHGTLGDTVSKRLSGENGMISHNDKPSASDVKTRPKVSTEIWKHQKYHWTEVIVGM